MENKDQERIKADAAKATNKQDERLKGRSKDYGRRISFLDGYESGYIAGATAENISFEPILKAAEKVAKLFAHKGDHQTCAICELGRALQKWKGKEVEKPTHGVSIGEHITYCHDCGFPVDECNCPDE